LLLTRRLDAAVAHTRVSLLCGARRFGAGLAALERATCFQASLLHRTSSKLVDTVVVGKGLIEPSITVVGSQQNQRPRRRLCDYSSDTLTTRFARQYRVIGIVEEDTIACVAIHAYGRFVGPKSGEGLLVDTAIGRRP